MAPKRIPAAGRSATKGAWHIAKASMLVLLAATACEGGESETFRQGLNAMQRGDYAEAFCIWRPLAEKGHTEAEYHLGWFYANGHGLKVDIEKAVYWWSRAAEQGHADSQYALAVAYSAGDGMEPDPEKAVHWLLKAAHQGNEDAQVILRKKLAADAPELRPRIEALLYESWLWQEFLVNVDAANVRAGPSTDAKILTKLKKGELVTQVFRRGDWARILLPGSNRSAWIYVSLLTLPDQSPKP